MPRMTVSTTITLEEDSLEGIAQLQELAVAIAQLFGEYGNAGVEAVIESSAHEETLANSPFTTSMLWNWWLAIRGTKAGQIVASVAETDSRGISQGNLLVALGNIDAPTFGGYLSRLNFATTRLKLPRHPLMKIDYEGERWYMFEPGVNEELKRFARQDGYYRDPKVSVTPLTSK